MAETEQYQQEKKTERVRSVLSASVHGNLPVETTVPGWEFYFIPSAGPLAGQPIRRQFTTLAEKGNLDVCLTVCRGKYGSATMVLAGRSLLGDARFGEWDV